MCFGGCVGGSVGANKVKKEQKDGIATSSAKVLRVVGGLVVGVCCWAR